jgi:hypothetical protein
VVRSIKLAYSKKGFSFNHISGFRLAAAFGVLAGITFYAI